MGVGCKTITSTSLGTGTTRTKIGSVTLPSWCQAILAVIPYLAEITPTTVQSVSAKLELESDSLGLKPFEVLPAPMGAGLGATFNTFTGREKFLVGINTKGGEIVDLYGTALVANTVAPEMKAALILSDKPSPFPQRHAKLGTLTASGTAADTDVAGTAYQISNAKRIVELQSIFHPKTIAAGDAFLGVMKYVSSEFALNTPVELPMHALSFGLGATGSMLIPGTSRLDVDIPVKPGQVNIQDYLYADILTAAAGSFISGVIYE